MTEDGVRSDPRASSEPGTDEIQTNEDGSSLDDRLRSVASGDKDFEHQRARIQVAEALFGSEPEERLQVGRYRVDGRIGAGGMGVVYRAYDPQLDRPIALKLLHALDDDERARARMVREARSLARLSHPNVIHVYDVGMEGDQVFVAMELVRGKSLRKWLDEESPSWKTILQVFLEAGRGLEAAHGAKLVHRDFKPDNVLVADDGQVKVLDFGLARNAEDPSEISQDGSDAMSHQANGGLSISEMVRSKFGESAGVGVGSLTKTGALMGTPRYMSPEQFTGTGSDAASDQFSFCVALFEALYGLAPFGQEPLVEHVRRVLGGSIVSEQEAKDAAKACDRDVPAELYSILKSGLRPDAQERFPDMGALLARIEPWVDASSSQAQLLLAPANRPWIQRKRIWLGLGVMCFVGGLFLSEYLGLAKRAEVPALSEGDVAISLPATSISSSSLAMNDRGEEKKDKVVDQGADSQFFGPAKTTGGTTGNPSLSPSKDSEDTGTSAKERSPKDAGQVSEKNEAEPKRVEKRRAGRSSNRVLGRSSARFSTPTSDQCYLHEDNYSLLKRGGKGLKFKKKGQCYKCRLETRRSRTERFNPRDCQSYALCSLVQSVGEGEECP